MAGRGAGKPTLVKTLTDVVKESGGVVGPHTFYAMPGRMLITGLSNDRDCDGRTGMVEYTNEGNYLATYWMPTDADLAGAVKSGRHAYGYDTLPRQRLKRDTGSSGGWSHLLRVFLIDEGRFVRYIYSSSFLDPVFLGNDIATLGLDRDQDAACARSGR